MIFLLAETPTEVPVPELLSNPWILSLMGWVLYNVGKLWKDKKKYDKNGDGLGSSEVMTYIRINWIGMLFSFLLLPFVVPFTRDIWLWSTDLIGKDWPFTNMAYGFIGVWMAGIQYLIQKFKKD